MKISLVIFPLALILIGCTSITKTNLYAVDSHLKGTDSTQETFTKGQTPVIYAQLGVHYPQDVVIKVLRTSDRAVINEDHPSGDYDWTSEPRVMPLEGLAIGKYTVELWVKGKLVNTLDISINDAGKS